MNSCYSKEEIENVDMQSWVGKNEPIPGKFTIFEAVVGVLGLHKYV